MQNFRTIGQGVFVGWVPENGMFPWESEVVLNTVLSANALHVKDCRFDEVIHFQFDLVCVIGSHASFVHKTNIIIIQVKSYFCTKCKALAFNGALNVIMQH
jgi:hypothetical protein